MAPAKFTPVKGLDELVAAMIAPNIGDIADETGRVAQSLAPPTKTWVSMRDARVRKTHRHADGDELPDNLRFKLEAYAWDLEHPGALPVGVEPKGGSGGGSGWPDAETVPGRYSYLRYPRDRSQGHYVQIVNCRCVLKMDPQGIARLVKVTEPVVEGTRVRATVYVKGNHVVQAERGEAYPGDLYAEGTWFMRRALVAMAARLRARR